ncbi:hypothetical protein L7F22_056762 [Adiantum nelumboides]|nr:hypothetical protein [Adiantum nelumboides]
MAMLTSSSPSSPFMFKPPPPCPPSMHHCSRYPTLNSSQPMEIGPSPIPMQPVKGRAKATKKKTLQMGVDEMKEESGAPSKKPKSSKKKTLADLDKEEEEGEQHTKGQWKEFWADQLIHVREGMSKEVNNPQKQEINLWAKIASRLASTYHDFDKDSGACRKKWAVVLAQYRLDKAHNATSGNDRKHTCKWYDSMDEYYHDRAQVNYVSHASSTTVADTIAISKAVGDEDSKVPQTKATSRDTTRRNAPKVDESLAQMADVEQAMLEHLKDNSTCQEAL